MAAAVLTVYGEFRKDRLNIYIERSINTNSPVPWGQVRREKPTKVLLVKNPDLGYDSLVSDWTAFHELSHLLLPCRGYGNIWFSEGLATYCQNIIQARIGLFDEHKMWQKIAAGFVRCREEQLWNHINLTEVSKRLGETRQNMRVHWSGVLYWLNADIELRRQKKGTLDDALKRLKKCCVSDAMIAKDIAGRLDELMDVSIFTALFQEYSDSHKMAEYKIVFTRLGIEQNYQTGGVTLDDGAPLADIRRQIYQR